VRAHESRNNACTRRGQPGRERWRNWCGPSKAHSQGYTSARGLEPRTFPGETRTSRYTSSTTSSACGASHLTGRPEAEAVTSAAKWHDNAAKVSIVRALSLPKWRNWQTQRIQNPPPSRASRFDPGLRHDKLRRDHLSSLSTGRQG